MGIVLIIANAIILSLIRFVLRICIYANEFKIQRSEIMNKYIAIVLIGLVMIPVVKMFFRCTLLGKSIFMAIKIITEMFKDLYLSLRWIYRQLRKYNKKLKKKLNGKNSKKKVDDKKVVNLNDYRK